MHVIRLVQWRCSVRKIFVVITSKKITATLPLLPEADRQQINVLLLPNSLSFGYFIHGQSYGAVTCHVTGSAKAIHGNVKRYH